MAKTTKDLSKYVIFLGIAEKVKTDQELPYPDGQIDIFRLTKQPVFIVFPVDISTHDLVFLFEDRQTLGTFKLSLQSPAGIVVGQIEVTRENISKDNESELGRLSPWKLASCNCKGISITEPGEYKVGMDVNANSYGLVVSFFTTKNMVLLPQKK